MSAVKRKGTFFDVESLRQNCGLFDVIEIAVPRKKYSGVPRYFSEFNNA